MCVGERINESAGMCVGVGVDNCAGRCVGVTGMFVGPVGGGTQGALSVDVHHEVGEQHDDELDVEVRRNRPRKDGFATM